MGSFGSGEKEVAMQREASKKASRTDKEQKVSPKGEGKE